MKAHRPGGAFVGFAHVDDDLAAVGSQYFVAGRIVVIRRPAQNEAAFGMSARRLDRGTAFDLGPRRPAALVILISCLTAGRGEIACDHIDPTRSQQRRPVPRARAPADDAPMPREGVDT